MNFVEVKCGLCGVGMRLQLNYYNKRIKNNAPGSPLCCSRGHYIELLRAELRLTEAERFWAKVDKTPGHGPKGECWPWIGGCRGGYGLFRVKGKITNAHRRALELSSGRDLDDDVDALHSCDFPPCCRPEHLFPGSHLDNMQDMAAKGRRAVLLGSNVGTAKLTERAVVQIRELYASGVASQERLGVQFGVAQSVVGKIVRREAWRHV